MSSSPAKQDSETVTHSTKKMKGEVRKHKGGSNPFIALGVEQTI